MNEGLIPSRYAKALLKFAIEKKAEARMYELMNHMSTSFAAYPELDTTMANPFISPEKKQQLLMTAAGADPADEVFSDFLKLLRQNNRLPMARGIALAYEEDYRKLNNIYKVEVTAAALMPEEQEKRLKQLILSHLKGGTMEYSFKVDPSLIGGFSVKVGSEQLDASVRNELKQLKLKLLG